MFSRQRSTLPARTIERSGGADWELSLNLKLMRVGVSKYATHLIHLCSLPVPGVTDEFPMVPRGGGKYTRTSLRLTVTRPAVSSPSGSCAAMEREISTLLTSPSANGASRRSVHASGDDSTMVVT
jgi:hypothetical protein